MRLTLRTLLAYLDDVLEPSETKLIGQKIQESAVAGKLISLIKLVVRQRRLKAPSVSGPNVGIDPNVVSQYLDNTLPAEQVVEVEKVLLTSDELLAEVASCHQILALVMGKPMEVSEASRERLYALGPVTKSDQLRVDEPSGTDSGLAAAAARDAERVNGSRRTKHQAPPEIPEYLRRNEWSQRAVPAAIIAALVLICAGLLYMDPSLLGALTHLKREMASVDQQSTKSGQPAATASSSRTVPKKAAETEASNQAAANPAGAGAMLAQQNDIPPGPATFNGIDPTPPPDAPEPAAVGSRVKPAVPAVAPNGAEAPVDAAVAAREGTPAPGTPTPNPPPVVNDLPAVKAPSSVLYASNEGVVLRLDEDSQHWFQLPRKSVVPPGELMAFPEPFESLLDFDHGAVIATVMGDSSLRVTNPNRMTGTGLSINRGRILLRSSQKDGPLNCPLSISVGADTWVLELQSADTVCTIEIAPREPVQFEKPFDQNWYLGILRVLSGSVKWTSAEGQPQQVPAQTALEILPLQSAPGVKAAPVSSAFVPEWTDLQKRKLGPLHKFGGAFEKEFVLDQPIEQSLLTLIQHKNAKISELAIRNLGLIGSHAALVQALAECDYEEGRFAARDGIRAWLGRHADNGPLLKTDLEMHFPTTEANAAYIMLWGFRPEDGSNKITSMELTNWLRASHIAVRELAYFWIVQLSNRKWEYRAGDVLARRDAAARKIDAHIQKDGALMKPSTKDSPTPKPE